jgi:hypothetical protein
MAILTREVRLRIAVRQLRRQKAHEFRSVCCIVNEQKLADDTLYRLLGQAKQDADFGVPAPPEETEQNVPLALVQSPIQRRRP